MEKGKRKDLFKLFRTFFLIAKAKKKNRNSTTLHKEYNISKAKNKMGGESVRSGRGENQDVKNPITIVGFKIGENRIFWNVIGAWLHVKIDYQKGSKPLDLSCPKLSCHNHTKGHCSSLNK
jgi:hypothetical protein